MAISLLINRGKKRMNRKEIFFSYEEILLLKFASKYYSVDMTSVIRILIRTAIIELITRQRRDGVPTLSKEMEELITSGGL